MNRSARIVGTGSAFPGPPRAQRDLVDLLAERWLSGANAQRLRRLGSAVQVSARHLTLSPESYLQEATFDERNAAYLERAPALAAQALDGALRQAGVAPSRVEHVLVVSTTGLATPSIDTQLVKLLGLSPQVRRSPLFGLGCVGGAAAVARAAEWLRGHPESVAAVVAVELCSLTWRMDDPSPQNLIASCLFADGAAAAVLAGSGCRASASGPRVLASRSALFPDTHEAMGFRYGSRGFKLVLSPRVPDLAREHLGGELEALLTSQGLSRSQVRHWVLHTGGPRVLRAAEEAFELDSEALAVSWRSLASRGNLSSASVLAVLDETMSRGRPASGELGVMLAMGPGFCAELVLLRW